MPSQSLTRRSLSLAAAIATIGVVWLGILPMIGQQPAVSDFIATQKQLGIDPSALYYTELEIAPEIAHHVERLNESYSDRFWTFNPPIEPHVAKHETLAESDVWSVRQVSRVQGAEAPRQPPAAAHNSQNPQATP